MCILLLNYIGKKCQGSQWKAFLCFELKGGRKEGDYYHKIALNQVKMKIFTYDV